MAGATGTKRQTRSKTAPKAAVRRTASPSAEASGSMVDQKPAQVDQELARYRSMRDFKITAEPKGGAGGHAAKGDRLPFVIQKHAATRLHYDFRLGWNGVLKSWAVTRGPSFYPGDKRLAVEVEDHPMEYGGFEGIIPKGQYGGGTVMLWDRGTWTPLGDADEGLARGNLKFELHGEKLKGAWALIRMHARPEDKGRANWLLIKEHDDQASTAKDKSVVDLKPHSVLTHRSLEEIAGDCDRVWNSNKGSAIITKEAIPATANRPTAAASKSASKARPTSSAEGIQAPASAPREAFPEFIRPQLAAQVKTPPAGVGWVHELKLDGYRMQAHIRQKRILLWTRNGLDWTHRMKDIAARLADLPVKDAILDGEVVVLAKDGGTSFADLQAAFQEGKQKQLTYFVFDLLHVNGKNLRNEPLATRKDLLRAVLGPEAEDGTLRYSEHLTVDGTRMFNEACRMGAEGIISKLLSSKYSEGRNSAWLKIKCARQQEFVVGGFTLPSNGGDGIGALLLGYYDGAKLVYAGRTGTGFSQVSGAKLRQQLESLKASNSPFDSIPGPAQRDAIWVKPQLVAEVGFATWTADNLVRQAAFKGLREDKPALDVRREMPMVLNEADSTSLGEKAETKGNKKRPREQATALSAKSAEANAQKVLAPAGEPAANASVKAAAQPARFQVRLTHPDKQIDAETKLTKQQLADYYSAVAEAMLPHIADRPLSIVRCPQGSEKPCFFQKHVADGLPNGIHGVMIANLKGGDPEEYITLSAGEALVGLAQLGVLEVHPWGSRNGNLERPDRLIFDLDPDTAISWQTLAAAALDVKDRLSKLGLESFVKSTGGKGLHVVAPIEPEHDWPAIKGFAKAFARAMVASNPNLYLMTMAKLARKGKIYIDYLRNERGATAVAPYSPRARRGATVAVPLAWKELDSSTRQTFAVADFAEWSGRLKRDPWAKLLSTRQHLSPEALQLSSSEKSAS